MHIVCSQRRPGPTAWEGCESRDLQLYLECNQLCDRQASPQPLPFSVSLLGRVSHIPGWPLTHYVAEDLKLLSARMTGLACHA